jgi:xanthine dehydrogenase accessory factor
VATQGKGDAAALERALASGARFTAFVGSARKAATLSEKLAQKGADPDALARLMAPAGLPIGAATAEEIALSILAQIVQVRRTGLPS